MAKSRESGSQFAPRLYRRPTDPPQSNAPKRFLTSFQKFEPDWRAIGFDDEIGELPAVRWKALNHQKLQNAKQAKSDAEAEHAFSTDFKSCKR
jgi:hypothetical protein